MKEAEPMTPSRSGRPRLEPRESSSESPAEEILIEASRLFARKGFASTTTREIAQAAGIQQPSIFYWFPTKWAILNKLIESSIVDSSRLALDIRARDGRAITRLYALLLFDTRLMCASPYDLSFLAGAPELRDKRITYGPHLTALQQTVEELIALAVNEGDIESIDPRFARMAILDLAASVLRWNVHETSVEDVADAVVRLAMRAVAADGVDLAQVAADAQASLNP